MSLEIYTLPNDDNITKQVMNVIALGLRVAVDGDVCTVDTRDRLKKWMEAERSRLNPKPVPRKRGPLDRFRESKYFVFWSELKPDQEVRWLGTKTATYFVVTGSLERIPQFSHYTWQKSNTGPWIQLRRHSGKTFWAHITQVRPLEPAEDGKELGANNLDETLVKKTKARKDKK